jgi:hypothetical protein
MLEKFIQTYPPDSGKNWLPHITIVDAHYPLSNERIGSTIREVAIDYGCNYLNPGQDLGSAQSQNWAVKELGLTEDDLWINLDPDSACTMPGWIEALEDVMAADKLCAIASLTNPVVWERFRFLECRIEERTIGGHRVGVPLTEQQWNMSCYRVSALNTVGSLLQGNAFYGDVEVPMYRAIRNFGWYNCYLLDFIEDYSLKVLEDKEFRLFKMAQAHNRKFDVKHFTGKFHEYCEEQGWI